MANPIVMRRLKGAIVEHALAIERMFTEPVNVTIFVRNPAHPDGSRDVHISSDLLEQALTAMKLCAETGESHDG